MDVYRGRLILTDDQSTVGPALVTVKDGKVLRVHKGTLDLSLVENQVVRNVIEVGNLVMMPGLVDSHVHVNEPGRTEWEGFASVTRAAAASGITTIVDMPLNSIPPTTNVKNLQAKMAAAKNQCTIDVAFWGGLVPDNIADLLPLVNAGVRGFKCFLVNSGVDEFPHVSMHQVASALQQLKGTDSVLLFHAEMEQENTSNELHGDPRDYATFLASRPASMEDVAIRNVIGLCKESGVRCHIVHLGSGQSVHMLDQAQKSGVPITAETCHHYLNLCQETVPRGATHFKCCPPVRGRWHREKLWKAIHDGVISMVVSDHSPCTADLKLCDSGDFMAAWGGISSVQYGLPLLWSQGSTRGLGLADVVRLMATNTTKLAGLDNRKGKIAPGYDADFVLWDPHETFKVTKDAILHKNKLTPYLGWTLRGVVHKTILRGRVVYDNGQFSNSSPLGQFLL